MPDEAPTDTELRALLAGNLPDEFEERLSALVAESPELQARLEELAGAEDFDTQFEPDPSANPATTKTEILPEVEKLITDLKDQGSSSPEEKSAVENQPAAIPEVLGVYQVESRPRNIRLLFSTFEE